MAPSWARRPREAWQRLWTIYELRKLARTRLKDAAVLFSSNRYDGSIYLCGYTIDLALKARICRTLNWSEFPETNAEFQGLTVDDIR